MKDEIDLLLFLIEKWDNEHNTFEGVDPIRLLASLMEEHNRKPKDLVDRLEISKSYVSEFCIIRKDCQKRSFGSYQIIVHVSVSF